MKIKAAFLTLSIFLISQTAFADTWHHKLYRGIEGIITSPLEYINQAQHAAAKKMIIEATFITVVGGTFMMGKRLINGAYDIVTFPLPFPRPYRILLNDPSETALDALQGGQGPTKVLLVGQPPKT